jgi:XTP/dITP diphosphohydrolase
MRRLLLATRSVHKMEELRALLDLDAVELISPDDAGVEGEPVEDATTFTGNAEIKVRYYAKRSGLPTLADDSGLEVDALDGAPGIYTKRYAGPSATDTDNNSKLLGALAGVLPTQRGARYLCVLAFLDPASGNGPVFTEGTFEGRIAAASQGDGGFGYDPIFEPADSKPGSGTVGEMSSAQKHERSHRGKAARAMAELLRAEGWRA